MGLAEGGSGLAGSGVAWWFSHSGFMVVCNNFTPHGLFGNKGGLWWFSPGGSVVVVSWWFVVVCGGFMVVHSGMVVQS